MRSLRYGGIYALPDGTKVVAYSNGAGGYVCYELIEGEGAGEAQDEPAPRTGTFIYLITLSTVSRLVTYFATCAALPILRRRPKAPAAAFLMPGGTIIATAGLLLIVWLLSNCTLPEVRDTGIALTAGLCLYAVNRALASRQR